MSKFKIEKVYHHLSITTQTCCIVDYYELSDSIYQWNYYSYSYAKYNAVNNNTTGIWRIKSLKNKTN